MNAKIKARWVETLRSGKYEQGRSQLKSGSRYCCLGVLCLLAEEAGIGRFERGDFVSINDEKDYAIGVLPAFVVKWADLRDAALDFEGQADIMLPGLEGLHGPLTLSDANDQLNWGFARIADEIEARL